MGLERRLLACALLLTAATILRAGELPQPLGDADFYNNGRTSEAKFLLGQNLFFDKLLSGNRNISCASCHHPLSFTGDALSLSLGEGGQGSGSDRHPGTFPGEVSERVGRNAQALFNLGAREFTRMFHDGRAEIDPANPSSFLTPAGDELPPGLDNVLAAQALLPLVSTTEMAGQYGENPVANAAALDDFTTAWRLLTERLRDNGKYVDLFIDAFPEISRAGDIGIAHTANALAEFQAVAWRADDSPFDRYLRGNGSAMTAQARRGMALFFGQAGCDGCHSGPLLTDHQFHSIGMPQIGPGKGNGFDQHEDFGREQVTGNRNDRHKFRTPSLRNVALSGPWGHDGAYNSLEGVVRHHLDGPRSTEQYDATQAVLPYRSDLDALDFLVFKDKNRRQLIQASSELAPMDLSDDDIAALLAFLDALTDPRSEDLSGDVPDAVPSGLPVAD
jgi:cytochrome c peroxidase